MEFTFSHRQALSFLLGSILVGLFLGWVGGIHFAIGVIGFLPLVILTGKFSRQILFFILVGLGISILRMYYFSHHLEDFAKKAMLIQTQNTTFQEIKGQIVSVPEKKANGITFFFEPQAGTRKGEMPRILVKFEGTEPVAIFDEVSLRGKVFPPENKENSTFLYDAFLKKDDVFLLMPNASLSKWYPYHSFSIMRTLSAWNRTLQDRTLHLWPGDPGALVGGILIGNKSSISAPLTTDFKRTGLSHIVAISGYNVTIVIIFVFALLGSFSKNIRITFCILFIILFCLFTGASSAVLRAGIMGCINIFAMFFERKSTVLNALLLSAVGMSLWNPYTLFYDIGFQLSMLAVVGLLVGPTILGPVTRYIPKRFALREILTMTLSAQLLTTPIMLYYFQNFSVIAPVSNVFVPPLIPASMLLSTIALLLSFLSFLWPLTLLVQSITGIVMASMIWITKILSKVPYASVKIEWLSQPVQLFLVYLCILSAFFFLEWKQKSPQRIDDVEKVPSLAVAE